MTVKSKRNFALSALLNAKSAKSKETKSVLAWPLKRLNGRKNGRNVNVSGEERRTV